MKPPSSPTTKPKPTGEEERSLIDKPWFVLATVFALTGALGIPMICICRGFTFRQKIWWSIVAVLYTAAMIAVLIAVLLWSYRRFVDVMSGMPTE